MKASRNLLCDQDGLIQGHLWVAAQLVEAEEMDLGANTPSTPAGGLSGTFAFLSADRVFGFADELDDMARNSTIQARATFARPIYVSWR